MRAGSPALPFPERRPRPGCAGHHGRAAQLSEVRQGPRGRSRKYASSTDNFSRNVCPAPPPSPPTHGTEMLLKGRLNSVMSKSDAGARPSYLVEGRKALERMWSLALRTSLLFSEPGWEALKVTHDAASVCCSARSETEDGHYQRSPKYSRLCRIIWLPELPSHFPGLCMEK